MVYQNSIQHKEKAKKSLIEARKKHVELKKQRIDRYNSNPILCKNCQSPIPYAKRTNKFCSQSCSGTYNNKGRIYTKETKQKISKSLTGKVSPFKGTYNNGSTRFPWTSVRHYKCSICENIFWYDYSNQRKRKTCSRECQIQAKVKIRTYQNGSRKPTWYYCNKLQENVLLESSWEVTVAEKLDELNIKWIRPKHIIWLDKEGISHLYFPDFYIEKFDVYLDPKNPYCMSRDKEKISVIKTKVNLVVGNLTKVLKYIENL